MDMYDIHQEMKNDCGDAQERIAMEEELDPLRSPLPTGGNEWERGFMESMQRAKRLGWTLSEKQIATLDRIRADEDCDDVCFTCEDYGVMCDSCLAEHEAQHLKEIEQDYAHMSEEEIEAFQEWAVEMSHPDVQSGSYGSVGGYVGACPLSYNSSGYSGGRGYHVEVCKQTGVVL